MQRINRGAIYYANLDPVVGSEQRGIRPVLVIQNNVGNRYSPTIIIAPISTKKKLNLPTHIKVNKTKKLDSNSIILLEQIRTIDKSRIKSFISILDDEKMEQVNNGIIIALGVKKI